MDAQGIQFFSEEVELPDLDYSKIKKWLLHILHDSSFTLGELNYIFCSDDYLLEVNKEYLDHDYYTDIITFDNSDDESEISGDIFISKDRVLENHSTFEEELRNEFLRVIVHGLHHLLGQGDKTPDEASEMRTKEDNSIALFHAIN